MAHYIKFKPILPVLGILMVVGGMNSFLSLSARAVTVDFQAVISDVADACSIILPDSTLTFVPLQANKLTGGVQTYQVKPLRLDLMCNDVAQAVTPSVTLSGYTPYSETDTVFLDGTANGVGFMVRQDTDGMPPLGDFYNVNLALANNGPPLNLTPLDGTNQYYYEEAFWVGLVGPFSSPVVPGRFQATLTFNVAFQ